MPTFTPGNSTRGISIAYWPGKKAASRKGRRQRSRRSLQDCLPCWTRLHRRLRTEPAALELRLIRNGSERDERRGYADRMVYEINVDGKPHRVELEKVDGRWECRLDGREVKIDAVIPRRDVLSLLVDGRAYEIKREQTATDLHMWVGNARFAVELRDPRSLRSRRAGSGDAEGPKKLVAPMPGRIVRVLVDEKAEVAAGQGIIVVEAMKMQNEIKSPKKGTVQKVLAVPGAAVNAGDVLAIVE